MKGVSMTIGSIISGVVNGASALLQRKRDITKWKMSKDGKEYYDREKENEMFDDLKDGDTDAIDIARRDKQKKIDKLRKTTTIIIFLLFVTGCETTYQPEALTVNTLKENEKTYVVKEEQILKTKDGNIEFNDQWVLVHTDLIKDFDRNQNDLLIELEKNEQDPYKIGGSGAGGLLIGILVGRLLRGKKT